MNFQANLLYGHSISNLIAINPYLLPLFEKELKVGPLIYYHGHLCTVQKSLEGGMILGIMFQVYLLGFRCNLTLRRQIGL